MKTVERPKVADKSDPRYFSIKTRSVKAVHVKATDDAPERYLIEGIASSSVEDRYGDTLTEACQASMLSQANGLTMWLNHSYEVPEDIAGVCVDPTLQRATSEDGSSCLDLKITLEIDPENPRAFKAWQHVNRGTRLAFSIGGYFTDFDFVDDGWAVIVNDVELLEISLVGIPANPRAYTKAFEVATEVLKAEVVKRAEAIVKEGKSASEARVLVRKSFGLCAEEVETVEHCAHKVGCTEPKADDSLLRVARRDAAPISEPDVEVPDEQCSADGCEQKRVDGAELCAKHAVPAEVKASVTDEHQQAQIVECMKAIANSVACSGHQMCAEPMAHASAAHAILKSMLPDDYDVPGDAMLAAPEPIVKTVADDEVDAFRKTWEAEMADCNGQLDTAKSSHEQLSAEIVSLEATKVDLERQIAELKATPVGRSSKSNLKRHPNGSSNGSDPNKPTVPASAYYR